MKSRLIVVVVFVCAVCHLTEAQLISELFTLNTNITNTTCRTSKLCVSSVAGCDPAGNPSCYFSSTQYSNRVLTVEISGPTSGYVALGLTPTSFSQQLIQGTLVFVCGNYKTNAFFVTAIQDGSSLTPANVSAINVTSLQGKVTMNLIQCTFNVTLSSTLLDLIPINSTVQLPFIVTILNGTTDGTTLGNATTVFNSTETLDLANPKGNPPISSTSNTTVSLNITRNGCNSTKLCLSSESNCDPAGNSSCFFTSVRLTNQTFFFELSGTTSGYVALALTNNSSTIVFVCGNNNTGDSSSFFFVTASRNGTNLILANVNTVYNYAGVVTQNQSLIQCVVNTSTSFSFNISSRSAETSYQVTILNGTTNGTQLGPATVSFDTKTPLDLSILPPNSSAVTIGLCTNGEYMFY
ncbi:uncharacterized protein Hap1MRO34_006774 [Clarias gariepinus]